MHPDHYSMLIVQDVVIDAQGNTIVHSTKFIINEMADSNLIISSLHCCSGYFN